MSKLQRIHLILKTMRAAGMKTYSAAVWAGMRGQKAGLSPEGELYGVENGRFSLNAARKAMLNALHLPADWIFDERDLATARASNPGLTVHAISFLLNYYYRRADLRESERALQQAQGDVEKAAGDLQEAKRNLQQAKQDLKDLEDSPPPP